MLQAAAFVVLILSGLYFIALATVSLFRPAKASRFLLGFAGSPLKHFTELGLRFVVGGSFVLYGPHMLFSSAFIFFGWILLGTTICLALLPWRWHRRFAEYAVPRATQCTKLIGWCSLSLGVLILAAVIHGSSSAPQPS